MIVRVFVYFIIYRLYIRIKTKSSNLLSYFTGQMSPNAFTALPFSPKTDRETEKAEFLNGLTRWYWNIFSYCSEKNNFEYRHLHPVNISRIERYTLWNFHPYIFLGADPHFAPQTRYWSRSDECSAFDGHAIPD